MSRGFRFFMVFYAAAMSAVAVGQGLHNLNDGFAEFWLSLGPAGLSYLLLLVGYLISPKRETAPGPVWLAIVFALALSTPALMLLSETPITAVTIRMTAAGAGAILVSILLMVLLLRDIHSEETSGRRRVRSVLVPILLVAGVGLVLASLFMKITGENGTGWAVIVHKAKWVTSEINVGTGILFDPTIEWLQPVYQPGGYLVYALSLCAAAVLLIWLGISRMSIYRLASSSIAIRSAVVVNLASLWVLTDIFWGWHFDLCKTPWAAVLATGLWLAGPVFGAVILIPLVWKRAEIWRLRAFLILQIPVVGFNLDMLRSYWGVDHVIDIPGLAALIVGLMLLSWACLDMLAAGRNKAPGVQKPSAESIPVAA